MEDDEYDLPYLLHPADNLVGCVSEQGVRSYVDDVLSYSTPEDKVRIVCAFFRIRRKDFRIRPSRGRKMKGGADSSSFEGVDPRFYAVLAAADSHHDFDRFFRVSTHLPTTFPTNIGATSFPERESDVVTMLSATEHLEFSGSPRIPNPLHGADRIQTTFFDLDKLHRENPTWTLDELVESNRQKTNRAVGSGSKLVAIDVVTHFAPAIDPVPGDTRASRGRSAILKLVHLADVAGFLREKLGPDASFVTDSSGDSLVRLTLGLKVLSKVLLERFLVLDGDRSLVADVPEKLMRVVRVKAIHSERIMETFDVKITDANRFDAATKGDLPIDPRPTGNIFHPDYGVQIELKGIPERKYVAANLEDSDGKSRDWIFKSEGEVQRTVSKNSITRFMTDKLTGKKGGDKSSLDDEISIKAALALKRAGDWGQVEHCKKYAKAFVTADKMAALYAWYRRVPFLFLKTTDNMITEKRPQPIEDLPEFVKYTFVIKW